MTEESTSCGLPPNDFDDSINLETKVLLALSRLQNKKPANKRSHETKAISCSNVVQFLKTNYPWLDGDIQSQVKTALLSFIKIGIVCILDNAKYRLLIPNSKVMSSSCTTRINHGPQCCCLFTLKCMLGNSTDVCCLLKRYGGPRKKMKAKKRNTRKKPPSSCGRSVKSTPKKSKKIKCLLEKKESWMKNKKKADPKCSFCSEIHPPKPKKTCKHCNVNRSVHGVPFDVFSPRDEVMDTS